MLEFFLTTAPHILILAALGSVVVGAVVLAKPRAAMAIVATMLFLAAITLPVEWDDTLIRTWLTPLQLYRTPLFAACGAALILSVVARLALVRLGRTSPQGWLLLAVAYSSSMMLFFHEGLGDSVTNVVFATITILPLILVMPLLMPDMDRVYLALRWVIIVGGVWIAATAVQFVLNRGAVVMGAGSRFIGMTGNPQFAAVFCSVMAMTAGWLGLNDPRRRYRLVWLGVAGVMVIFTMWTGSRTGFLMLLLGGMFVLYRRIGRAVVLAPLGALVALGLMTFLQRSGIDLGFERLTDTTDTRSSVWRSMIDSGVSSPLVGVGPRNVQGSENSYLKAFASYGIIPAGVMLALAFVSALLCLQLWRRRAFLEPRHRPVVDLILGFNAAYFAGSNFEGFIEARVSTMLVYMLLFGQAAMTTLAVASARRRAWLESGLPESVLDMDDEAPPPPEEAPAWSPQPWGADRYGGGYGEDVADAYARGAYAYGTTSPDEARGASA